MSLHASSPSRPVLQLLGEVTLTREGARIDALAGAPKRLAVLTYLLLAEPAGFQRRDALLALFWPESAQSQARTALRNVLHLLRQDLGEGVIVSRGNEDVGIAPDSLDCDVLQLRAALRADHLERALALYRGPLLPAFFVPNADASFDDWLDGERRRLERSLSAAADALSRRASQVASQVHADAGAPLALDAIAVVPFVNLSPDADSNYFADGMIEALIGVLARTPGLRVAARSSSFAFRGTGAEVTTIARRLGVGTIIDGSIRRAGAQVRVTVCAIDGATGFQRWSAEFERELQSVFALQDEIADAIAAAISVRLPRPAGPPPRSDSTHDLAAYELYLEGVYQLQQRGIDPLRSSIALFQRALALDSRFALAQAALASAWHALTFWAPGEQDTAGRQAEIAAERAVALDDRLADAHAVLATRAVARGAWADADARFRHAIALAPSQPAPAHWYADYLQQVGRAHESLVHARHALALDPVSPVRNLVVAVSLLFCGELAAARDTLDTAYRLGLDRDGFVPLAFALDDDCEDDRTDGSIGALLALDAHVMPTRVRAALRLRVRDVRADPSSATVRRALDLLIGEPAIPTHQRFLLSMLGDDDARALELGSTLARASSWFMSGFWLQRAQRLREQPAFAQLMHEIGLFPTLC